jgi:hypothetical protein
VQGASGIWLNWDLALDHESLGRPAAPAQASSFLSTYGCSPKNIPPHLSINGNAAGHSIIIENDFIADILYTVVLLSLSPMHPMARLLNKIEGRSCYPGIKCFLSVTFDKSSQGFHETESWRFTRTEKEFTTNSLHQSIIGKL